MSGSKTPRKPTSGSASDPSAASLSRKRNNKQAGLRTPSPSTATDQATLAAPNPVVNDEDLRNPEPSNSLACEFNRPDCEDSDSRTDIGPSHPNLANEDVEMTAADSPDNSSVGEAKTPRSAKRSPRSVFDSLRRGSGASGGPAADSDSESKETLRALASRLLRRAVFLVRGALRLAGTSWQQPQPQSEPHDEHMVPTLIDSYGPKPDSPLGAQCYLVSEAKQIAPNETMAVSDWHASVTPPAATPAPPVGGFKASAVPDSLLSSKLMNTDSDIDARCDPNGDGTNKNPTPTSSDGDPTDRCQSVPSQLDVTTFVARRGP